MRNESKTLQRLVIQELRNHIYQSGMRSLRLIVFQNLQQTSANLSLFSPLALGLSLSAAFPVLIFSWVCVTWFVAQRKSVYLVSVSSSLAKWKKKKKKASICSYKSFHVLDESAWGTQNALWGTLWQNKWHESNQRKDCVTHGVDNEDTFWWQKPRENNPPLPSLNLRTARISQCIWLLNSIVAPSGLKLLIRILRGVRLLCVQPTTVPSIEHAQHWLQRRKEVGVPEIEMM